MSDIADRVGISRAHVYNHFDNKKDVFCALAEQMLERCFAEIAGALQEEGEVWQRIEAAFHIWTGLYYDLVDTPHGAEVFEEAHRLEGILTGAIDRLGALLTAELRDAARTGAISLSAATLSASGCADALVAASDGFKSMGADRPTYNRRLRAIIAALRIATATSPAPRGT
jgi:AcrR family transcriptional regulator